MPTPLFPNQIATDAQLKVAANLIETKLQIAINATDTVLFVASTVGFAPNMLVSIDKEIIAIGGVSPAPDSTLLVATAGRGFDGTTAAPHAAKAKVSVLIDAWHHNALSAELQAVQTALGTNLSNISSGGINSNTYNFNPQLPGGNLVVGNNSITLAPVPPGVNGTDTDHWLYISGGTGAAEAVPITGGSAVSGAASGTVIVTCANAHSGAWTIRSATAGIQEALQAAPSNGATIQVPAGLITLYAPVTVSLEGARIIGTTRNNVSGYIYCPSGVAFDVKAGSVEIACMAIRGGATAGVAAPAGNIGIRVSGSGNCVRCHFHDLMLDYLYGGVLLQGGYHHKITNIWSRNMSGYVIKHTGGVSPMIDTVSYATDPPNEVAVEGAIVINASGAYIYNADILCAKYGIRVEAVNADLEWTFIYDSRLDQNFKAGVYIFNNSVHELRGVFVHDLWSASAGGGFAEGLTSGGLPPSGDDGVGLIVEGAGAIREIIVDGGQIHNNRRQNIKLLAGTDIKLHNLRLLNCNLGNAADIDNVFVATPGRVEIVECEMRGAVAGKTDLRSAIIATTGVTDLTIRNNRFAGTWTAVHPIHNLASLSEYVKIYGFNLGMDETPGILASAATVLMPPRQYFHITGTSNINTLTPTWQGRKIYLHNPDAGSWQLTSAGNIAGPLTVATGTSVALVFVGTKWLAGN